jgi:hypothetical protein
VPARALGTRAAARSYCGEREGLEDMRRALALAIAQAQGRAAATLHNNLAIATWNYAGPQAALEVCREGIDFSERRGIAEVALTIAGTSLAFLAELGRSEHVLAEAEPLVARAEAAGNTVILCEVRSVQLRLRAQRGEGEQVLALADWLTASARETKEPQLLAPAFAASVRVLLSQTRAEQARALVVELEQTPVIRTEPYYAAVLPDLVRSALAVPDAALAGALVQGVEATTPLFEHALVAARAQLAEEAGNHEQAATLYAEAGERWRGFGNVPERAYALLGQGRCLAAFGRTAAEESLSEARELFEVMGFAPAAAETDALLGQTAAAAR